MASVVISAGGHAHVVVSILRKREISILGVFDDSYAKDGEQVLGTPVVGRFADLLARRDEVDAAYLAIGDNQRRKQLYQWLIAERFKLPPLVHPMAKCEERSLIGDGSVICLNAMICVEASVGRACIINTGASIDHESIVGDFVHLAPKVVVAGRTSIGDETFVGMNSVIADRLRVGDRVTIGANSVVLSNVDDDMKIVGVHR